MVTDATLKLDVNGTTQDIYPRTHAELVTYGNNSTVASKISEIEGDVASIESSLTTETTARTAGDSALNARIDNLLNSSLSDDTEIQDARVNGVNAKTYTSLKNRVDGDFTDLTTKVNEVDSRLSESLNSMENVTAENNGKEEDTDLEIIIGGKVIKTGEGYVKPPSGIPQSDLSSDVQKALEKANTAIQEVPNAPTKLSELTSDSTHRTVTDAEKNTWNNKSNFSGSYNDLTNKPNFLSSIPIASSDILGGIKAEIKTSEDTQPVRIGSDGKLYVSTSITNGNEIFIGRNYSYNGISIFSSNDTIYDSLIKIFEYLRQNTTDIPDTPTEPENPDIDTLDDWSARKIVDNIKLGWNLANTLESTQATVRASALGHTTDEGVDYETSWGQPQTTLSMINSVKAKGFNAIRIPVTWNHHLIDDGSGNITISSNFMQRVRQVVDYAYNVGMYVILNSHHDTADYSSGKNMSTAGNTGLTWQVAYPYQLFNVGSNPANETQCEYMRKLWIAIANEFKEYDYHLIFEGFNEILDENRSWVQPTNAQIKAVNALNNAFVSAVRSTGGNNAKRALSCQTFGAYERGDAITGFSVTDTKEDGIIMQVHYYTDTVDESMNHVLDGLVATQYPVIIGEQGWGVSTPFMADNLYNFAQNYVSRAYKKGIKCFWWDNNSFGEGINKFGLLNRSTLSWDRPNTVDGLVAGIDAEPIEIDWDTIINAESSNLIDGTLVTKYDTSTKAPGSIEDAPGYGRVVLTLSLSNPTQNDIFNVSVGNMASSAVGDANAFKIKRIVWLDADKKALQSVKQDMQSLQATVPYGAKYVRLGLAQVYTKDVQASDVKSELTKGTVWITVKATCGLTVDTTGFDAVATDPVILDSTYLKASDFTSGRVTVDDTEYASEGFYKGDINTVRTSAGVLTATYTGFNTGDTLKVTCSSPGYGNSDTVIRINRWAWYDDSGHCLSAQKISTDPPFEMDFEAPMNAKTLKFTVCNPWSTELTSSEHKEYISSQAVLIRAVPSTQTITKIS